MSVSNANHSRKRWATLRSLLPTAPSDIIFAAIPEPGILIAMREVSVLISKIVTSGSRSLALGAFALATASVAPAQIVPGSYRSGDILVEAPWSRASPGGAKVASGYMRITNVGPLPDRLIGGSAAVAGGFEVHLSTVVDGISRMEPVTDGLEIKPAKLVELRPGGAPACSSTCSGRLFSFRHGEHTRTYPSAMP